MNNKNKRLSTEEHDRLSGIVVSDKFERFKQRNDIFTRAFWDDTVKSKKSDAFFASYRIDAAPRKGMVSNKRILLCVMRHG